MDNYCDITKGVRNRDMRSQMGFYDMFFEAAYRSALAIVGNSGDAEEIAQDSMLKIFQKTAIVSDDRKSMERIVRRISSNAAIDVVRRRKDFIFSVDDTSFLEYADEAEDEAEYDFSIGDIQKGVERLPLANRSVLALRLFEEMPFEEIAKMLGVKSSTARVQYVRGIAKLKQWLIENKRSYDDR